MGERGCHTQRHNFRNYQHRWSKWLSQNFDLMFDFSSQLLKNEKLKTEAVQLEQEAFFEAL